MIVKLPGVRGFNPNTIEPADLDGLRRYARSVREWRTAMRGAVRDSTGMRDVEAVLRWCEMMRAYLSLPDRLLPEGFRNKEEEKERQEKEGE